MHRRKRRARNLKIKIYKTITLLVLLYDCGTWYFTLREECIFGPKKDKNGE